MRFSSVGTALVDDDASTVNLDQLKLGMTVRVTGETNDTAQTGTTSRLELVRGTRSTLGAIAINAGTFALFGSTATSSVRLKLKGVADMSPVYGLLTVSGTQINILKAVIKGASTTIVAGQFLEVKGDWNGSVLQATEVEQEGYRESQIGGRNALYGTVSSITGSIAVIDGVTVDLSAAVFQHGSLQLVSMGSYVEIKGNMKGNTLVATKIELKTNSTAKDVVYEQSGVIQGFTSVAGFKLNGLQIDASQAVFEHGAATGLANGIYIEIKGAQNSSGIFVATKVEIKTASQS